VVEVPLVVPHEFLRRLLVEQVFTEPGASARIVGVADPCNEIVLSEPRVGNAGDRLLVTAHGEALAGFSWLGGCFRPFSWDGEIEAEEDARLSPDAPVVSFPVVDSRLRRKGSGWLDAAMLWDWVKPVVHPRLETLRVDLGPLVSVLRRTLPLFAAHREEAAVARLAESIELAGARVEERGLVLRLRFEVETASAQQAAPAPEPPLTSEEALAFDATLREWDAFVTFVVKIAGHDSLHPAHRAELLAVLIDARHELVAALEEPGGQGDDRVRALFSSAWIRLAPALGDLAGGDDGFRYLAFVAAGDALAALDAAGPGFGVEISSDGLRRLARTLAPAATEDPLGWSEDVDPALRETFGFDVPLPALPPPEADEAAPEEAPPSEAPSDPEPEAPAQDLLESEPDTVTSLLRWFSSQLAALLVTPAFAAPAALPPPAPHTSALDAVAPGRAELDAYLPKIAELLRDSASLAFAHGGLERERLELFRQLVLASAWQESCWRQYVERRGRIEPLRSGVGALGLMQVHPRVWRGFYAVDGLAWSIGYNARAGSEILLHYLRDYAIARGEELVGGPDALARASYAAYHGGPSHLRRYREAQPRSPALVAIDRAFYDKYRSVSAGRELAVRDCFPG
jgi:soluble lytic murein transglycosylase-like protein